MKKTLKKITQVFKNKIQTRFNRHYDNIEKGEKIVIDGKEFVKVKLRFVDTMDFNLAKHVDNLELDNLLLKNELLKMNEQYEKHDLKLEQLQFCITNMFRENSEQKKIIQEKKEIINNLADQIKEKGEIAEMHSKNVSGQGKKIKELEAENKSFQKKEKLLENEIKLLNGKISGLTVAHEKMSHKLKIQTKETKKIEKADRTPQNDLKNKQLLIDTLTEKLFNQKNEIDYLRTKLKNTLTTTANPR